MATTKLGLYGTSKGGPFGSFAGKTEAAGGVQGFGRFLRCDRRRAGQILSWFLLLMVV